MFGFSVRESSSPPKLNSNSKGEIDTRAPFQSVRAAMSLFGEPGSPRPRPLTKKTKDEEQKLVEKEARHHMILRQLQHYKDELRSIESGKAQLLRDLQLANQTLQDMTNKLDLLSDSKQEAKLLMQGENNASMVERELYKLSSRELISCKQQLTNLRQDFDLALKAKLAAFQESDTAHHSATTNQETHTRLSHQLSTLGNNLHQLNFYSLRAQEEQMQLLTEKEVHLLVHRSAKEAAENEIHRLREECSHHDNLLKKLQETTEAIKVLQEQLNNVRDSDMHSLQAVVLELQKANKELQEAVAEEASITSSVDSLKLQLEEVRRKLSETEKPVLEQEERIEQMQIDLERAKAELESATSRNVINDMESQLEKLVTERKTDKHEAQEITKEIKLLRKQAEAAIATSKEVDQELEAALNEAKVAKVASSMADDQIYNSPRTNAADLTDSEPVRKIRLSNKEFRSINHKIEECQTQADEEVATLMAQLHSISASKHALQQKAEGLLKECEQVQMEFEDAVKQADMAEAARSVVEGELRKWREMEESM